MNSNNLWNRYSKLICDCHDIGLSLDISRMKFTDDFLERMEPAMQRAFIDMMELEGGAIANPDEGRMVGHYGLRNPALAPSDNIRHEIESAFDQVLTFSKQIHKGIITNLN